MIAALTLFFGALGAVTRFVVDAAVKRRWPTPFPWATFVINVSGSFLLGAFAAAVLFHGQPAVWQTVVGTGFCGGYTTFSTASFETVRLVQQRAPLRGLINAFGSLLASVLACLAGLSLVSAL